jgi:serine/threonine-protein kinase
MKRVSGESGSGAVAIRGLDPRQGALVADRFRLEEQISEGAMGTVWRAMHIGLEIPCAVKFIHAHLYDDPELQVRFEREARAAASIRSPHVVQMLDYGFWEGSPYIVMELLDGEDLSQRLERRGRLTPSETIAILAQVCRGLAKAHAAGLVHRDLKPENIFLVRDDDRELVKVLDFGIVRVAAVRTNARVTQRGMMIGTPSYMSPEQAMGQQDIDLRSDLWSLAVVAHECLTGNVPFTGPNVLDIAMQIISGPTPMPPVSLGLPRAFDVWWWRAVSRERSERFSSAREQIEALAAAFDLPRSSLLPSRRGVDRGDPVDSARFVESTMRPPPGLSMPDGGMARTRVSELLPPLGRRYRAVAVASAAVAALGAAALIAVRLTGASDRPPSASAGRFAGEGVGLPASPMSATAAVAPTISAPTSSRFSCGAAPAGSCVAPAASAAATTVSPAPSARVAPVAKPRALPVVAANPGNQG